MNKTKKEQQEQELKKISKGATIKQLPPKHSDIKIFPPKTTLEILEHQEEFVRGWDSL